MNAVVTGGAGFIGSHLVDRLLQEGHTVTVVDNMSCGRMENLAQHAGNTRLVVHQVDIKDAEALNRIFSGHDVVFHLAAQANIRKSLLDHRSDLDNNLIGTLNVLDAMIKNGVSDLVFASTSAVYGEATLRPTPETYFPYQTSLYGASKLACEAYTEAYTEFAPLKFWAFRFANVIGERCRRGVIWDFTHKLKNNPSELEILGDGKQSKEYLHVKDCVEGILIGYRRAHGKTNIFNLGLEEQTSVDHVADLIMDELGLDKTKVPRRYSGGNRGWIGDNPQVVLSIEKIKKHGWKQSVPSEEAIRQTARWTLQHL
ncbi:MAG: SDR family NAD(P)-dependent oxidoreductase [Candidatus Bathyarchaeota archaeon]|nr:SDR family NAD(P)-dependent oxidoreductase [Candidatus Bathyarchaeota archaeon]